MTRVIFKNRSKLRVYLLQAEERSGGREQGSVVFLFNLRELSFAILLLALLLTQVFGQSVEEHDWQVGVFFSSIGLLCLWRSTLLHRRIETDRHPPRNSCLQPQSTAEAQQIGLTSCPGRGGEGRGGPLPAPESRRPRRGQDALRPEPQQPWKSDQFGLELPKIEQKSTLQTKKKKCFEQNLTWTQR